MIINRYDNDGDGFLSRKEFHQIPIETDATLNAMLEYDYENDKDKSKDHEDKGLSYGIDGIDGMGDHYSDFWDEANGDDDEF